MPDAEQLRAAAEQVRRARPPSAGALGGHGLAEAYAWSRQLAVTLAALEQHDGDG